MTIRLYHPNLDPPNNEAEVVTEEQAAVMAESGWLPAPEPTEREGYAPEPPTYRPVAASAERPNETAKRDEWADYVEALGGDPDGKTIAELKAAADDLETDED